MYKRQVDEPNEEGVIVYHLHVAAEDMGRVIGKQGRIAKAVRTLMRAAANRSGEKIMVEIDWFFVVAGNNRNWLWDGA